MSINSKTKITYAILFQGEIEMDYPVFLNLLKAACKIRARVNLTSVKYKIYMRIG
jgi:hypothetical protein